MKKAPIIIIDDDSDDIDFIKGALQALTVENEIITFTKAIDAIKYFEETTDQPFFILCDINMPELNGLQLRSYLHKNSQLRLKTVPFLFLSTGGNHPDINSAYDLSIQGYFIKSATVDGIEEMLKQIIGYWSLSHTPTVLSK